MRNRTAIALMFFVSIHGSLPTPALANDKCLSSNSATQLGQLCRMLNKELNMCAIDRHTSSRISIAQANQQCSQGTCLCSSGACLSSCC
jgi:hypothetical protein